MGVSSSIVPNYTLITEKGVKVFHTVEEILEVFSPEAKMVAYNVSDVFVHKNKQIIRTGTDDWTSTLHKRGFEQIVDDFLVAVESGRHPQVSTQEHLRTHKVCEEVVEKLKAI